MRRLAFLWVGTLLSGVTFASPGTEATVEEQALVDVLEGDYDSAIDLLESGASEDPLLKWVAGQVALQHGDYTAAWRLFEEDELANLWGRIEVSVATDDAAGAVSTALAEMDRAMSGQHREVLGQLLVTWARERSERDPDNASAMLEAVLNLEVSDTLRRSAEDVLFRLSEGALGADGLAAARKRVIQDPQDLLARGVVGRLLADSAPERAFLFLKPVVTSGEYEDALRAAGTVASLALPDPLKLELIETLGSRFPQDREVAQLRLRTATAIAASNEAVGTAALSRLIEDPQVGPEAFENYARLTREPTLRRERWLAFAELEGVSARGDRARQEARDALIAIVASFPEGKPRRDAARDALKASDGQGIPEILYWALEDGNQRLEALWDLTERFPGGGPWCKELAERLVTQGADEVAAERFARMCGITDSQEGNALRAFAAGQDVLLLFPAPGRVNVLATGDRTLKVSEHKVDPEALFRATEGHPLETDLDAFLIEADTTYELEVDTTKLMRQAVFPRTMTSLVSLTLRVGGLQATTFVVPSPLEVQAVVQGDSLALAALEDKNPVVGAEVLVQDSSGEVRELKTDETGTLLVSGLSGDVRAMVRKGEKLGFVVLEGAHPVPDSIERFEAVFWDRAIPTEGAKRRLEIFGTRPDGSLDGPVRVRSYASDGEKLDETAVTLSSGAAMAELWLQGGGRIELLRGDEHLLGKDVPATPRFEDSGISVSLDPPYPEPGQALKIQIFDVGPRSPDGRAVRAQVTTPWSSKTESEILRDEPMTLDVDLLPAAPGEDVDLEVELGGHTAYFTIPIASPAAPSRPQLPELVAPDSPVQWTSAEEGAWLRIREQDGTQTRWIAPNKALVFQQPGMWWAACWLGGVISEEIPIRVVDPAGSVDTKGRWNDPQPMLVAETLDRIHQARLVRQGDMLRSSAVHGASYGWTQLGLAPSLELPAHGALRPALQIQGKLRRGGSSSLVLGQGLPMGTTLWAFLQDASDIPTPLEPPALQDALTATTGRSATLRNPPVICGEQIQEALLEEEARVADQGQASRIRVDEALERERSSGLLGALGGAGSIGSGMGRGGGGYYGAGKGEAGYFRAIYPSQFFEAEPLAVLDGGAPGPWQVQIPSRVTRSQLMLIARTPDGRWLTVAKNLAVGGDAPSADAQNPRTKVSAIWDGSMGALFALARTLPIEAQRYALAALVSRGYRQAEAPLRAALAYDDAEHIGQALAAHLNLASPPDAGEALARLQGLPDQLLMERATAALEAAAGNPERGRAVAQRLLREPGLDPWVKARAGLALWVGNDPAAAQAALEGDDVLLAAARAVVTGKVDPRDGPAIWNVVRSEAANPYDRALAIHVLSLSTGTPISAGSSVGQPESLKLEVQPALAAYQGQTFSRGASVSIADAHPVDVGTSDHVPALRVFPVQTVIGASVVPTRVHCPDEVSWRSSTPWIDLAPAYTERTVSCLTRVRDEGPVTLQVSWYGPSGKLMAEGSSTVQVDPPRASTTSDPMSPDEEYALGLALAREGKTEGVALLKSLLGTDWLAPGPVSEASYALLEGVRKGADAQALIDAFEAYRERATGTTIELATAAEVAKAYAKTGASKRAISAVKVVLDARFQEELAAIRTIQEGGLTMSALKLLKELLIRYPEVPTVIQARYLAPSMLLRLAEGDGDRYGYTRASLRHTAAGELARFLLLHEDAEVAPEAATLLIDALQQLRDPAREQALAGPLAARYRTSPSAWLLSVADARARLARGKASEAADILEALEGDETSSQTIALELGRVYEAKGDRDAALEQYARASSSSEAAARMVWLERKDLVLPPILTLRPGETNEIDATLREGTEVELAAYRISLEHLLLRDGGTLRPDAVRVDGLRPEKTSSVKVNVAGDIPLPKLSSGAYLVTLTLGGFTHRTVLLRTDGELNVRNGGSGDTLVHLVDGKGRPVQDARLWFFDASSLVDTGRTDVLGSAHLESGAGLLRVLARWDSSYAWWDPGELQMQYEDDKLEQDFDFEGQAPSGSKNKALLQQNADAYEGLFQNPSKSRIQADML